jgi:hypothetical protein
MHGRLYPGVAAGMGLQLDIVLLAKEECMARHGLFLLYPSNGSHSNLLLTTFPGCPCTRGYSKYLADVEVTMWLIHRTQYLDACVWMA